MGFRTMGISLFVVLFMSMSSVMGYLANDIPNGRQKFFVGNGSGNIEQITGVTADNSGLNNMSIGNNPQDELSTSGLGFKGYTLLSMVWNVVVNSTWGFGDYIIGFFNLPASASTLAFSLILSWMLMFNHAIVLYQIIFRPMGGEA